MSNKLALFIITYNRSKLLGQTLEYLVNSSLSEFSITVLDNASTDDTVEVAVKFKDQLPDLTIITNNANVGPNANFLKAFEYSKSEYTWILCDDDTFDLTKFSDVLEVIETGKVDLIHVGAHKQRVWILGGECKTPRELLSGGYAFFKFASFMPCNIFRTKVFIEDYLVKAYNNIGNSYPHMPYAFGMYTREMPVYISKEQIVTARLGGQSYLPKDWFIWWMKTCALLPQKEEIREAYLNQWKDNDYTSDSLGLESVITAQNLNTDSKYPCRFVKDYFTLSDKIKILYTRIVFLLRGIDNNS